MRIRSIYLMSMYNAIPTNVSVKMYLGACADACVFIDTQQGITLNLVGFQQTVSFQSIDDTKPLSR